VYDRLSAGDEPRDRLRIGGVAFDELRDEWFDAATVVGLTAGTSTPDEVIDRVEARIRLRADASAGQVRLRAER